MAKNCFRVGFECELRAVALRTLSHNCQKLSKLVGRSGMLRRRGVRPVINDPEGSESYRVILLDLDIVKSLKLEGLTKDKKEKVLGMCEGEPKLHTLKLTYKHVNMKQVLRQLLPKEVGEVPHAFEAIGHVAHLNLRDELLPYKKMIGEVLLDKNPKIRSVVNKTSNIHTEFRTLPLEILAGEDNLDVQVKQHGNLFKFNVQDVYWNSRLEHEHHKLVSTFSARDVIADACCGVGPFAIPAAKKGCKVYANDLNPKCYEATISNAKLNKVEVCASNEDARVFIRRVVNEIQPKHIILNLPATAINFLDALIGAFDEGTWGDKDNLPRVHCYCFSKEDDWTNDVKQRVLSVIRCDTKDANINVREVRDVAPKKLMLCAEFEVPRVVAFAPPLKRTKKA